MSKDIYNINSKGQRHEYQERYWLGGKLWYKCFYNNDVPIDYEEYYYYSGKLSQKVFYI